MKIFDNRTDAGRQLAEALEHHAGDEHLVILALPRGGVPVAYQVASALGAPLDVLVVRKLGAPHQPELAMGAVASGGVVIINDDVTRLLRVSEETIRNATDLARAELEEKERRYRRTRAIVALEGETVILVDDGAATGATMRAAIEAAKKRGAAKVVVALTTASGEARNIFAAEADEVVCLETPDPYIAVGCWYRDFGQTSDEEVAKLLEQAEGSKIN
jgi:predicted phosphoribosyltransferase